MDDPKTRSADYSRRLEVLGGRRWKRWLNVQAPYRANLRRLDLGFVLDVGCGVGRNLLHLDRSGVGIDHNPDSVALARSSGCEAYTDSDFPHSLEAKAGRFDSLLFAHVLEHMSPQDATELVGRYLDFVRPGGRVVFITPQEAGFRSDPTHVHFMGFEELTAVQAAHGILPERAYSFPFPRFVGRVFLHNEFVVVGRKPLSAAETDR